MGNTYRPVALTLAIGAIGGAVFYALGLPVAFLSGAMMAVGVSAIAGVNVSLPMPLRNAAFVVLGIVLGSTINQETIRSLPTWPITLMSLVVCVAALIVILPRYFRSVHGMDARTAKLCAIPGNLSFVVALASDLSADVRRVALVQTLRVAILIVLVPAMAGIAGGVEPYVAEFETRLDWTSIAIIGAFCVPIAFAAQRVKVPAAFFIAPMFFSGALFATGLMEGQMPTVLLWPALVVVGASVGVRFYGADRRLLSESLRAGLGGTALSLLIIGVFAFPLAYFLSVPVVQIWLAFAPGGLEAMTVLAFSLGIDPAFVAGHQIFRFAVLSLVLPFLFRRTADQAPGE